MEKLNKEELVKKQFPEHGGIRPSNTYPGNILYDNCVDSYKAGLEYAEEHYLKIIENLKNVCLEQDKNAVKSIENNLNSLELLHQKDKELQQAKELLKKLYWNNVKEYDKEIEEFLNK